MVKKEELFSLVKSMSMSEKRYFKLYNTDNKANYMRLFDAIDNQVDYNDETIKKKFRKEKFVKQLHVTKNYLRNAILQSLRNYHSQVSNDAILKDCLRNIEILYNRELYEVCAAELKKASAIADKYEIYTGKIEVLNWQRKLAQVKNSHDYSSFYNTIGEQERALAVLDNSVEHWKHMVLETWKTMGKDAPKDRLTQPSKALTLQSEILRFNTAYISYLREGKNDKGGRELKKLIFLLEQNPHRLKEELISYIATINNLVSYMIFSKKDKEAIELINKAKRVYEKYGIRNESRGLLKQLLRTYNLELEIYRNMPIIDKVKFEFINETAALIEKKKSRIPQEYLLSFWFQLAHIYFMHTDIDNALHQVNNIINNKFKDARYDLQIQGRILNLMIHFQQKNYFVLRYFVDSTRRFIRKIRPLSEQEEILFKFFSQMSTAHEYERKDHYKKLRNDIAIDYTSGAEINYQRWIDKMVDLLN